MIEHVLESTTSLDELTDHLGDLIALAHQEGFTEFASILREVLVTVLRYPAYFEPRRGSSSPVAPSQRS